MQLPAATSQSLAVPSNDTLRIMSLDKDQTKSKKKQYVFLIPCKILKIYSNMPVTNIWIAC